MSKLYYIVNKDIKWEGKLSHISGPPKDTSGSGEQSEGCAIRFTQSWGRWSEARMRALGGERSGFPLPPQRSAAGEDF